MHSYIARGQSVYNYWLKTCNKVLSDRSHSMRQPLYSFPVMVTSCRERDHSCSSCSGCMQQMGATTWQQRQGELLQSTCGGAVHGVAWSTWLNIIDHGTISGHKMYYAHSQLWLETGWKWRRPSQMAYTYSHSIPCMCLTINVRLS